MDTYYNVLTHTRMLYCQCVSRAALFTMRRVLTSVYEMNSLFTISLHLTTLERYVKSNKDLL